MNTTPIPTHRTSTARRRFRPRRVSNPLGLAAAMIALAWLTSGSPARADDGEGEPGRHRPGPELPSPICDPLEVPAGNRVGAHLYASGVQIYRWNGSAWEFIAPDAELFADACFQARVGLHYAGPTWEANDGSWVRAAREAGCAPYRGAIPWLRLRATETSDPGRFGGVTFIQRVNTIGGTAPGEAGAVIGEEARVPYTAEYYLYRAAQD